MSIYSQSNYQQYVFGGFYQCLITMFTVCMQLGFVLPNKHERFPQRCPSATVPSGALRAKRAFYVTTPTAWLTGIYAATSVPALALCAGARCALHCSVGVKGKHCERHLPSVAGKIARTGAHLGACLGPHREENHTPSLTMLSLKGPSTDFNGLQVA